RAVIPNELCSEGSRERGTRWRKTCGGQGLPCPLHRSVRNRLPSRDPSDFGELTRTGRSPVGVTVRCGNGTAWTGRTRELSLSREGTYAVISDLTISLPSLMTLPQPHGPSPQAAAGARPLALRIGYDMHFELAGPLPTAMLFMLYVHPEVAPQLAAPERLVLD